MDVCRNNKAKCNSYQLVRQAGSTSFTTIELEGAPDAKQRLAIRNSTHRNRKVAAVFFTCCNLLWQNTVLAKSGIHS
tara:strand:+ start:18313 stop:18543 length:231 start_codon:yes stop_codon:yes gene_type:complete